MKSNRIIYWGGILLTAGIAYALGWLTKPETPVDHAAESRRLPAGASLVGAPTGGESRKAKTTVEIVKDQSGAIDFLEKHLSASGTLSPAAMKEALEEAFNERDLIKSNRMIAAILDNLTVDNAAAAFESLNRLGMREPRNLYMAALFNYAWGQLDGPAAIAASQEAQADGPMAMMGVASAMAGWATESPDEALAWLNEQEDGMQKTMYTAGMINGLARSDPEAATRVIEEMEGDAQTKNRFLEIVATQQLKDGIEPATKWASSFADDELKANAFENVATQYTQQDPVKAAEWIEAYGKESYAQKAVTEVADEWAEKDPAAAVAWAGTLAAETQVEAMSSAFQEWAESDPTTASQFLNEMEPGLSKDGAIRGFTNKLAGEDPEAAITWAGTIQDESVRIQALTEVGQSWYRQDQEAASVWLETSGLPAEARESVVTPPSRSFEWDALGGARRFLGR